MAYSQMTITASAAKRVRHFDCWVFRDELERDDPAIPSGETIELIDRHGTFIAYALYHPTAHIAARVLTTLRDHPPTTAFFTQRIAQAIQRRAAIQQTNAKRLIFSEADGLPGLIVDQYGQYLILQSRSAGIERWKSTIVEILRDTVRPRGILERSDKEFREEERLPAITQVLFGAVPDRIPIEEAGLKFVVDPHHGQKTGFYLDQRNTRRLVRDLIQPNQRVLDVCAYTGAFGIGAASRGASVVCVEQQEALIPFIKEHAILNGVQERVDCVAGDAFYWLEAKAKTSERFDWVLLDPPSLAKTKAEVTKGRQALHHLLVHALQLLNAHGTLVLSICTYHLLGLTEEILRIAAADCNLRLRVRSLSCQAEDHPWVLQIPSTRYLMSWIVQRDADESSER